MDMPKLTSRFQEHVQDRNRPYLDNFTAWRLQPGMRFRSPEQWWGKGKPRPTPHEGLDLYAFGDAAGRVHYLDETLAIPATWEGEVIKVAPDFLGQSIFLAHEVRRGDGRRLLTAYGHTAPVAGLAVGQRVAAGEVIAHLAGPRGRQGAVPPHLHITLAWMAPDLPEARLAWPTLGADPGLELLDPLLVLGLPWEAVGNTGQGDRAS